VLDVVFGVGVAGASSRSEDGGRVERESGGLSFSSGTFPARLPSTQPVGASGTEDASPALVASTDASEPESMGGEPVSSGKQPLSTVVQSGVFPSTQAVLASVKTQRKNAATFISAGPSERS